MVKGAIYIIAAVFSLFAVTSIADIISGLYEKSLEWRACKP